LKYCIIFCVAQGNRLPLSDVTNGNTNYLLHLISFLILLITKQVFIFNFITVTYKNISYNYHDENRNARNLYLDTRNPNCKRKFPDAQNNVLSLSREQCAGNRKARKLILDNRRSNRNKMTSNVGLNFHSSNLKENISYGIQIGTLYISINYQITLNRLNYTTYFFLIPFIFLIRVTIHG